MLRYRTAFCGAECASHRSRRTRPRERRDGSRDPRGEGRRDGLRPSAPALARRGNRVAQLRATRPRRPRIPGKRCWQDRLSFRPSPASNPWSVLRPSTGNSSRSTAGADARLRSRATACVACFAFALTRHFPWPRGLAYRAAQFVGALCAAALLRGSLGNIAHVGASLPSGVAAPPVPGVVRRRRSSWMHRRRRREQGRRLSRSWLLHSSE
jgi:hypothetical protein